MVVATTSTMRLAGGVGDIDLPSGRIGRVEAGDDLSGVEL
jgi:hypothetical protein